MLGERSGIHLKRQAYHNEIRKQHHSAFFSHLRQQLVHHITQNPPHPAHDTA